MAKAKKKRFEYKATLYKDINGHTVRKSYYSTKSKADAKKKADRAMAQYELKLLCDSDSPQKRVHFKSWALQCLEVYKKPFVKRNTYNGTYLTPVENRLIPAFGDRFVDEIKQLEVQEYINRISKELKPETVKKDFAAMAFIMRYAVENGLCKTNPASSAIRLPKIEKAKKRTWTQAEYDIAYQYASQYPNGLSIMLLMETGISRSEMLGLRQEDVDLTHQILHIRQGLVSYTDRETGKWVMESSGLKNDHRRRDIPLVDPVLLRRLALRPTVINVEGKRVRPEFVFHSPEGKAYDPNNWNNRVYKKFIKDLIIVHPEIPALSVHELRHTRATLWLEKGVSPLMAAKLLGHTDLKMLLKVYDHTNVETLREAIISTKKGPTEG